jgi:glycosyltransferase involved in cell wall biosynthesis
MSRRIALISEHASPLARLGSVDSGGQNVYVAQVARQLARRGYRVDVFTRRSDRLCPTWFDWEDGVRVIHVPAGPPLRIRKEEMFPYMDEFTDWMLRYAPYYDLYHANFWMSGFVAMQLRRRLGTPFVVTFHALGRVRRLHQGLADEFPREREETEKQIVDEADMLIAECPQDVDDQVTYYGADRSRIRMTPCGYDPQEFFPIIKTVARRMIRVPDDVPVVLQLGRLVPRKGIDNVICALGLLKSFHGIHARLIIVGGNPSDSTSQGDPELARLHSVARLSDVAGDVEFVGQKDRESLKYYYSAADIFVTTPWYEPFGITPLEAMACGVPVVGSNVGGIKYTVKDGATGILVAPRDAHHLASAMATLLGNPQLREAMGARALARVKRNFTWERVAERLSSIYAEVIDTTAPREAVVSCPAIVDAGVAARQGVSRS